MVLLSELVIERALPSIAGWKIVFKSLEREYGFPDFKQAMIFVNEVAEHAEAAGHHPDIDIRYNKVRLRLTSHDEGGITQRDIDLAKTLNAI